MRDQEKNERPATRQITTAGYAYDANGNSGFRSPVDSTGVPTPDMTNDTVSVSRMNLRDGVNTLTGVYPERSRRDAENRIVSSSGAPGTGAYVYDGNGLRVKKCLPNCSNPTTTTVYIYSGHQVIAAYDNGAAPTAPSREYILAGGTRLAKIASGATVYYHRDQVSTRVTTDANGNVISQQGHYPFGESWYQTGSATTDQQFTTYQRDTESGNDYALAREFVNRLGRFSSLDPLSGSIGDPQSLNRYAYAANDPIDLLDPEGEYVCVTGCGVSGLDLAWDAANFDGMFYAYIRLTPSPPPPPPGISQLQSLLNMQLQLDQQGPGGGSPGGGGGGGGTGGTTTPKAKNCYGEARIVGPGKAGNGKYGPTTMGSLAVVPTQFFGSDSTNYSDYVKAGASLRPYASQISASIVNQQGVPVLTFSPVTDVMNRSGAANLINKYGPDTLILEVNGFYPENGAMFAAVVVHVPAGLDCPVGTTEGK